MFAGRGGGSETSFRRTLMLTVARRPAAVFRHRLLSGTETQSANLRTKRSSQELTMIKGSCLCGGVKFEIRGSKGPFELCHCNRCRKATGSAFAAGLRVRGEDLRIVQGQELIKTFEAP